MARPASTRRCPDCGQPGLKRNGTRNGRTRWRCTKCGSSPRHTRPDITQTAQFSRFLAWLTSKDTQARMDQTATGRTFRDRVSWCWNIPVPTPPVTGEIHEEVFIDGKYQPYNWCVLIARSSTHVLGWQWCNRENSAAYKALLTPIPPPMLVVTDGHGGALKAIKET